MFIDVSAPFWSSSSNPSYSTAPLSPKPRESNKAAVPVVKSKLLVLRSPHKVTEELLVGGEPSAELRVPSPSRSCASK
ncbi:MAG TPA: hypothetical protein DCX27_05500 [Balneola sp.]|nr:hypothetical protein [Balneola sp.]